MTFTPNVLDRWPKEDHGDAPFNSAVTLVRMIGLFEACFPTADEDNASFPCQKEPGCWKKLRHLHFFPL
jgi:hypothetical protein